MTKTKKVQIRVEKNLLKKSKEKWLCLMSLNIIKRKPRKNQINLIKINQKN